VKIKTQINTILTNRIS